MLFIISNYSHSVVSKTTDSNFLAIYLFNRKDIFQFENLFGEKQIQF